MSDPSQPKAPPGTTTESPTRAFVLKMDGWMADLIKDDLALDPAAPEAAAPDPAATAVAPDPAATASDDAKKPA